MANDFIYRPLGRQVQLHIVHAYTNINSDGDLYPDSCLHIRRVSIEVKAQSAIDGLQLHVADGAPISLSYGVLPESRKQLAPATNLESFLCKH